MLTAAWVFQFFGLLIAFMNGWMFSIFYITSVCFFWLYSSPNARWKGRPLLSFVAIGGSTVVCSVAFGYLSFGGKTFDLNVVLAILGATLLILSMYPLSQLYQIDEDKKRGDRTFAVAHGARGVKISFSILFLVGVIVLALALTSISTVVSSVFVFVSAIVFIYVYILLKKINPTGAEYKSIMKLKYTAGLSFTLLMLILAIIL